MRVKLGALLVALLAVVVLSGCTFRVNMWGPTFVKWNSCGPINVYVNPGKAGPVEAQRVVSAIEKVKAASGLPLVYAGATQVVPTSRNNYGYTGGGNSIIFAFVEPGTHRDIAPGYVGYGGTQYGPTIVHGYAVIDRVAVSSWSNSAKLTIYMHELGHTVGLEHPPTPGAAVMDHIPARWDGNWAQPDLDGLRFVGSNRICVR